MICYSKNYLLWQRKWMINLKSECVIMENNKHKYQGMDDSDCIFSEEQIDNFFAMMRKYKLTRFPFLNDDMSDSEMDEKIKEFWEANPEEKQKFDDNCKKFEENLRNHSFLKQNDD